METHGGTVRVAAANDYELVVNGLASMLERFGNRIMVCDRIVLEEPIEDGPIDVVLYDTYGRIDPYSALADLAARDEVNSVAMFSLELGEGLIAEARAAGARGFISKTLSAEAIVDAICRVADGEEVVAADTSVEPALALLDWPAKDVGLSERESQVLALLAQGHSNAEIGSTLYIGVETVKTHVRQVFAKLNVRNRVQAANYVSRSDAFRQNEGSSSDR